MTISRTDFIQQIDGLIFGRFYLANLRLKCFSCANSLCANENVISLQQQSGDSYDNRVPNCYMNLKELGCALLI